MFYLWASVIILIIYAVVYYTDPNRKIDKMFPGPFRLPFFGNALLGINTREGFYKLCLKYPKYYNHKTFRVWFLNKPYVIVPDYKVAKAILSNPSFIDKATEYKYFEPWLGKAIFTSTGEKWKKSRKLVTPAFHFKILNQFFQVFHENAEMLCKKLEKNTGKDAFDIYEYVALCALNNVCATAMGVKQPQSNLNETYVKAVKDMITVFYYRVLMIWLRSDAIFKISNTARLQEKSLKTLHSYTSKVIQDRKIQLQQQNLNNIKETEETTSKEKMPFLDTLLENAQVLGFTDEEVRQEVDTVMFAAHDTLSSSLGFILYALAEHLDVQAKIHEELNAIFQKSDRCPSFEDLQEMKYMEQAIKETLRLYPVVPAIARKLNDDLHINETQYIPKGSDVAILLGAIHQDPQIWSNPEKFDPERFSPEASQNRDSFAFIPFSAGSRNCLGQKFAMYQMKITLSNIIRKYQLSLSNNPRDKIRPKASIVMVSANGINLKIQARNI